MTIHPVLERLKQGHLVLLDGALGSELDRREVPTPLPLWSAAALHTHPKTIQDIHADYINAGADVITTATFRTTERSFAKAGRTAKDAHDMTRRAVELARQAISKAPAGRSVAIAGGLAPLEDCYRPELSPSPEVARTEHARQARLLADCGVDLLLIETMNTVAEARAALAAAKTTSLPVWVSLIPGVAFTLLDGTPIAEAITAIAADGPDAMLLNCLPASYCLAHVPLLRQSGVPFGFYANSSTVPGDVFDEDDSIDPGPYLDYAKEWLAGGAKIVGGCCGTTPEHIARLAALRA